jgi:transcriptional regulator with XRE-family HTH domain
MQSSQTAELIRRAREKMGLTQSQFGALLGRPQSVVSKYERGLVEPPGGIIIQCMNMLDRSHPDRSADEVAQLIKSRLSDSKHATVRNAIVEIIERLGMG